MRSIASAAVAYVEKNLFLKDALARGIINYQALAEEITPSLEQALGKKIKVSSVMMALRRYSETLSREQMQEHKETLHVQMNANISLVTAKKTPSTLAAADVFSEHLFYRVQERKKITFILETIHEKDL